MMNPVLIKAFGVCTAESTPVNPTQKTNMINELAKRGFIAPYEILNEDLLMFVNSESVDYNSTFYKNWDQMRSRSRLEQFIGQMMHYASTYGTGFLGEVYTVNDNDRSDVPDFKTYKLIQFVSVGVVVQRCINMLTSGIAMSNELVSACVDYISDHKNAVPSDFVVDNVKNREAMIQLCDKMGIRPSSGVELVRWIVYKTTENAALIKDRQTICDVKFNAEKIHLLTFSQEELKELSKVFFRFKPIILALKQNPLNKHYVNMIRRMAKKYHTPMKEGFWQTVLGEKKSLDEISKRIDELNNFKIVSLIQIINERKIKAHNNSKNIYFVRNGKAWIDMDNKYLHSYDEEYLNNVKDILYHTLIKRLSLKNGTFKYPASINIACPVSEKKFAGNLPYGSAYKLSKHNYFGIYWMEKDGTRDFDLSFNDKNGYKIGWNSSFRNGDDILFSGDMTSAYPDATEIIYFRGGCGVEGTLWNNRFSGQPGSKYRYFMGRQEIDNLTSNYMVDPNTVEFEEWTNSENAQEMMAVVFNNKIYPYKTGFGQNIVSHSLNNIEKFDIMKCRLESSIDLKQVLLDAGFEEYVETRDENGNIIPPDYDFINMDKDTLIELFSDNN